MKTTFLSFSANKRGKTPFCATHRWSLCTLERNNANFSGAIHKYVNCKTVTVAYSCTDSPRRGQLWRGSWTGNTAGWWKMRRRGQHNASPGWQKGFAGSHCETGFPSSHSTCPCHELLSKLKNKTVSSFKNICAPAMCQYLYKMRNTKNHLNFILQVFSQIPFGYLNSSLDGANVWALIAAAVKVPGDNWEIQWESL